MKILGGKLLLIAIAGLIASVVLLLQSHPGCDVYQQEPFDHSSTPIYTPSSILNSSVPASILNRALSPISFSKPSLIPFITSLSTPSSSIYGAIRRPAQDTMPKKLSKQNSGFSTNSAALSTLPRILSDGLPLPRAVVFDLDYTLWPFWVDTHVYPPLRANADHSACADKIGETFSFYRDIKAILHGLSLAGVKLGVASRTSAPDLAKEMLRLLHVPPASAVLTAEGVANGKGKDKTRKAIEFFDMGLECYPSTKIRHFEALHKRTSIPFSEMLFFDDESRNRDTESLGVTMWLVRDGVSWGEIEKGIKEWRRRRGIDETPPN
ncbi:acid phosphatase-domain-containing protein [Xylariaceae sp. FL1019]|nr:acid phosphatase-domain-containing protein [Xylariaceae sp. FL1019]